MNRCASRPMRSGLRKRLNECAWRSNDRNRAGQVSGPCRFRRIGRLKALGRDIRPVGILAVLHFNRAGQQTADGRAALDGLGLRDRFNIQAGRAEFAPGRRGDCAFRRRRSKVGGAQRNGAEDQHGSGHDCNLFHALVTPKSGSGSRQAPGTIAGIAFGRPWQDAAVGKFGALKRGCDALYRLQRVAALVDCIPSLPPTRLLNPGTGIPRTKENDDVKDRYPLSH